MKILFYIHGITGGGGERVLATLANEFAKCGENVNIATNTHIPFAYKIDSRIVLHDLYEGTNMNPNHILKVYNSILMRRNIRRIAKEEKPDVIVAFMSALGCSVIASTLGLGIPVVVSEHTNVSRKLGILLDIKRRLFYPLANAVTILTRYDKKLWKNKYDNVVYMPNPVSLKETCGSLNREKTVLAVGRVNQWEIKGFDNLLRCWSKLCHLHPDWKLNIAGDADKNAFEFLNTLANELGCCNYEFLGFRKDVYELMQRSEIFCLSSRVEGLPMALIEAMNAGCCCVSFDVVTGPREIIHHGFSGLIAKNQDNEDLIEYLDRVMSDDVLRKRLALNAPQSIIKYSTDRIINRWYILFDKILKK